MLGKFPGFPGVPLTGMENEIRFRHVIVMSNSIDFTALSLCAMELHRQAGSEMEFRNQEAEDMDRLREHCVEFLCDALGALDFEAAGDECPGAAEVVV